MTPHWVRPDRPQEGSRAPGIEAAPDLLVRSAGAGGARALWVSGCASGFPVSSVR